MIPLNVEKSLSKIIFITHSKVPLRYSSFYILINKLVGTLVKTNSKHVLNQRNLKNLHQKERKRRQSPSEMLSFSEIVSILSA